MTPPPLIALLDASVLYPAALRDLLMRLALHELFRSRWSAMIHREWIEALLRNRPDLDRAKVERTRALMDEHASEAVVEGFESLIETLELPDPDDRHVLAAAIYGQADVIVTKNLRDFPAERLEPFGLEALHPDPFVLQLFRSNPGPVLAAAREHRLSLKNPPKDALSYLETLESQELVQTVSLMRDYAGVI